MSSALHPISDNIKVKVDAPDPHGFSNGESVAGESGIVVEFPSLTAWLGFHSFAFEESFNSHNAIDVMGTFERLLLGKRVYWESFQDSGRRMQVDGEEFVLLKLTDIIAYSDDPDLKVKFVTDARRAGSFSA